MRVWIAQRPSWWAWPALAALLLIAGGLLLYETRSTFFWADEWQWILARRGGGIDTFLQPHNEHLSLVPVILYKLLFALAGLSHYWPYRGLLIATEMVAGILIFAYARPRVGGYYALLATGLILFFGPGWQDLLWPFQTAWFLTVVGGVGALGALDRRDRVGDVAACVLTGVAVASASAGVAIAVGLLVDVLLSRRRRDLWIVLIPLALYGLWWITYQQTNFNPHSLLLLPRFVFDSAAGTLSSLAGLATISASADSGDYLSWGAPLLTVGIGVLVWRLRALGRIPARVASLSAILLAFWILTGVGRAYLTFGPLTLMATGDESRYLYIGAVFLVLLAVELARTRGGVHPRAAALAGLLTIAAIVSNLGPMQDGGAFLRNQAQYTEAGLETMDISRSLVAPSFVSSGFLFQIVTPTAWFAAARELGAPPLSAAQLVTAPDYARSAADQQLIKIQRLALSPTDATGTSSAARAPAVDAAGAGTAVASGACLRFTPAAATAAGGVNALAVTVPSGGLLVRAGSSFATVSLRRFSSRYVALGTVASGAGASLVIKPDLAPEPWHVQVAATSSFSVCGRG
jgi:hypothetical protein